MREGAEIVGVEGCACCPLGRGINSKSMEVVGANHRQKLLPNRERLGIEERTGRSESVAKGNSTRGVGMCASTRRRGLRGYEREMRDDERRAQAENMDTGQGRRA